ncbi:class I SAM-dependent methyltransferase [Bacillus sp. HMF5848]|uniref:class I SAM-dependent methyltransferase n=1 Tax=Bacillus sp. HMF5848 TaxID=2495421 RepID=UPI000F7A9A46|nr:class I SAM-dependent methyltransferase [Bacillus sp. HMF5848]RSK28169.1 class I SAM-dependent methyltransferase [Bacillus sp. HMF5848]
MKTLFPFEQLYNVIDDTANIVSEQLDCTYLEAIAETCENLHYNDVLQDELSEVTKKRLLKEYEKINLSAFAKEDIRKAYQLTILKGMKEAAQPNHQMTPDAVGIFVGYLVSKFMKEQQHFTILDPTIGTGNLLSAVVNQNRSKLMDSMGVDLDDLLLKLAYVGANLMEYPLQLFHQDSLEDLLIDPADVVVCDLPVGYYPNDERAKQFETRAASGHSYAHHLFIEQSINYMRPGGYGLFLVPNTLFETEQSVKLNEYIKQVSYIQGFIQLPNSMFKQEAAAKSILILQKKATEIAKPKQALLVSMPKFSNKEAMQGIMAQIDDWFVAENK